MCVGQHTQLTSAAEHGGKLQRCRPSPSDPSIVKRLIYIRGCQELAKVGDFLGFGFEIFQAGMGQNEVQNQQTGSDQFIGKAAAIAQVIAVESAIDLA